MAELSTIARPYARGLWQALVDGKATAEAAGLEEALDALSKVIQESEISAIAGDPKVTNEQFYDLIVGSLGQDVPAKLAGLLRVIIENGRVEALPEIAAQFRALKNESEGVADAYIETAYALQQTEVDQLVESLKNKFPGLKLNPVVTINPDLIGGVSIRVGDQVLDGSVRARLAQMQAVLTA